jgi:catechol 2,3-dioxygenase-like lactoylglutathione lyase family enzyme
MRGPLGGHPHETGDEVSNLKTRPRVTSFAPQFLVDDLERSISYYRKVGFTFGEPWEGFYAIGEMDGLELHLKEAPKSDAERQHRREHEHLDAAAGVDGIEAFYGQCVANGVTILRPLAATAWGTKDFYIEDPDGYIIAFGGHRFESRTPPKP